LQEDEREAQAWPRILEENVSGQSQGSCCLKVDCQRGKEQSFLEIKGKSDQTNFGTNDLANEILA